MRHILTNCNLLVIATAEIISGLGTWITLMAVISIVVFRQGGGVAETSGLMLAGLGPFLVMGPVAGNLADKLDRRRLMVASQLLSAMTVLALMGADTSMELYVWIALGSVTASLMMPARQASIPLLVSDEDLTGANALLQQLAATVKIAAPMLAGGILAVLTPSQAMLLDVASYVAAGIILTRLPKLPPPVEGAFDSATAAQPDTAAGPWAAADPRVTVGPETGADTAAAYHSPGTTGSATSRRAERSSGASRISTFEALRRSPELALLFAMAFATVFVIMGFDVLSSVLTRDLLAGNESLLGVLISLVGLGTVIGSVVMLSKASMRARSDPWRDALAGLALLAAIPASVAVGSAIPSLAMSRFVVCAGCLIGGFGSALINVQAATLLQRGAPRGALGRLSGLFQSTLVAGQLIAILTTPLYVPRLLGLTAYFSAAAFALGLLVVATALTLRAIRSRVAEADAGGNPPGTPRADAGEPVATAAGRDRSGHPVSAARAAAHAGEPAATVAASAH